MTDPVTRLNTALVGRYRILSELGEGGMATVYLADDVKHERKVALKVLKPELAAVVGAKRFLAEIKTTANLQHPHVLPLFDSGEADSYVFYVMPYVEGESLRERIDREKQLPVDEAVRIATAVANALQHAHERGVIHRDIKPANILIQDGEPLVADFGIALAVGAGGGSRLTETGLSLGTPYYMSPEQATGDQEVGPASDIYALAAVLYELLTGDPPYIGSTAQAVLGKIIQGEPVSATAIRKSIPANVDAAIRRALEKLPADRFADAQGFARALADPSFRYGDEATVLPDVSRGLWNPLSLAATGLAVLFGIVATWSLLRPEPAGPLAQFSSPFEEGQAPIGGMDFTTDGSALVYVGSDASGRGTQLWTRRWADLEAVPISGTDGAVTFVLSPDTREVAFSAGFPGPLRVVPLDGGPGRTLVEQVFTVSDWSPDGTVYFQRVSPPALSRIPATSTGREVAEIVTEFRERESIHSTLSVLPGGKMAVFQVSFASTGEDAEVWAVDLESGERRFLAPGHSPRYASSGHLLFATPDGSLMAAPIDPRTAELTGPSIPVVAGLNISPPYGVSDYSVSENGTLIFLASGAGGTAVDTELVWVTRSGDATPVDPGWRFDRGGSNYGWSLSPDGGRLALSRRVDDNTDIWIKQLPDGPLQRLTFDDAHEAYPAWTPDGRWVMYMRAETELGNRDAWRRRADGSGAPELVLDDERSLLQGRWSPDGAWLVFRTAATATEGLGLRDIVGFRPGVDSATIPLVANAEFAEQSPALSPDGRWLAYQSDETGRAEVYVRPFPDVAASKVQVSTSGGVGPLWANSGSELFFVDAEGRLIAAELETDSALRVVQRRTLFTVPPGYMVAGSSDFYDIAPDDQRFLMGRFVGFLGNVGSGKHILILNWLQELKRLVPN